MRTPLSATQRTAALKLAWDLEQVSEGRGSFVESLQSALSHRLATRRDCDVLRRYLAHRPLPGDGDALFALAERIADSAA